MAIAILLSLAVHVAAYFSSRNLDEVVKEPEEKVLFLTNLTPMKPKVAKPIKKPAPPPPKPVVKPAEPAPPTFVPFEPLPITSAASISSAAGAGGASSAPPGPAAPPAADFAPVPIRHGWPELPAKIAVSYKLTSSVVNGQAQLTWMRNGARYEAETTIRATGLIGVFVGAIRQVSRGQITREGLKPDTFSLTRGSSDPETADFLRATNELRMKSRGDTDVVALPAGLQDTQSFLFQMGIDANRFEAADAKVAVSATNARKIYQYVFHRVADEPLTLPTGTVTAWHLVSEAADPEDVYEVWLAPELHYLPVKMKFHLSRYLVEQTATQVLASGDSP